MKSCCDCDKSCKPKEPIKVGDMVETNDLYSKLISDPKMRCRVEKLTHGDEQATLRNGKSLHIDLLQKVNYGLITRIKHCCCFCCSG